MRALMRLLLAVLLLAVGVSFFYPRVTRIHVSGGVHYSEAQLLRLARVRVGYPLLWVTAQRVAPLARDPWILAVQVVRRFPNTLYLNVTERTPVLSDGATAYALDGTVLPDATPADRARAVPLTGWGPDRSAEAVELFRLVAPRRPRVLSYAPSGFTVSFAQSTLFTPDAALLKAHWSAYNQASEARVAVYPWGVSVGP